ncbi:protein-export chaperone SecB, partial [Xanthomonas citri pv. citri]
SRDFLVTFEIVLSLSQGYLLEIEHSSIFTSNVNLDKKFQESNFPKVNAPAIAYPFLRTFIANFLLNSGYEPIILPSINFTKFKKVT